MPDDLTRSGPEDQKKIDVNQSWEIDSWTKKLEVSEQELKDAVSEAGPLVVDVERHLGK